LTIGGPRPALWNQDKLTALRDKYDANNIKPGLTGWAQINGRDELELEDKAKLDGDYFAQMISAVSSIAEKSGYGVSISFHKGGAGSGSCRQIRSAVQEVQTALSGFKGYLPGAAVSGERDAIRNSAPSWCTGVSRRHLEGALFLCAESGYFQNIRWHG
jgi:hypothetical protein